MANRELHYQRLDLDMNIKENVPHRRFCVGKDKNIVLHHCADIELKSNEQVTFIGDNKHEYDVVKTEWGYYATPSVNNRLIKFKIKTALTQNSTGQIYVMLVHEDKISNFQEYCVAEKITVLEWISERL